MQQLNWCEVQGSIEPVQSCWACFCFDVITTRPLQLTAQASRDQEQALKPLPCPCAGDEPK